MKVEDRSIATAVIYYSEVSFCFLGRRIDVENTIRHSLKSLGVRPNQVGRGGFERAVREAVTDDLLVSGLMTGMLRARAAL